MVRIFNCKNLFLTVFIQDNKCKKKYYLGVEMIDSIKSNISYEKLIELSKQAKSAILTMTTLANSGHPGGSMSSVDILLALYHSINVNPEKPLDETRDKVVVSHGHISPAVYSTLALRGFFNLEDAILQFRMAGSAFEGHIETDVPGVEWGTGNLGQGLSVATGFALESKLKKFSNKVFCLMGDGEQQKGQLSEARRFAVKYNLNNITAIIDFNKLQICGDISNVMPHNVKEDYEADGWAVLQINGHDYNQIFNALNQAQSIDKPVLILAETIMGNGVSFMENKEQYHGSAINENDIPKAYDELGYSYDYQSFKLKREKLKTEKQFKKFTLSHNNFAFNFKTDNEIVYTKSTDNRSAWGEALANIAKLNNDNQSLLAVFDCDLKGSVKTADFEKVLPDNFLQTGIMEHHAAVCSGALSSTGVQTFFADFGVFGIDETYNQHRLNDINNANLKVILTHVGLDVGEDGKTHQCVDYIGLVNNMFNFKLIIPADPNQTFKVVNYVANQKGNYLIPMGRSKLEIIKNDKDEVFFDKNYQFSYGKADVLREGSKACLFVTGTLCITAVKVVDYFKKQNIDIKLINISTPLDIERETIHAAVKTGLIFTLEDHNVKTGLAAIISQRMIEEQLVCSLVKFGVENYACSGTADDVYASMGLDFESIKNKILNYINV